MTITAEQKAEHREAKAQADAAIARLNDLYTTTGRSYRVRLETYALDLFPDLDDIDHDQDDGGPVDGYRPTYRPAGDQTRVGSERAEREDEGALDDEADDDDQRGEI